MKTFTFAGTARETDGRVVFRATNRDGYAKILAKEGKTDINIQTLPHAMTKEDAQAYVGYVSDKPAKATKVAGIKVNPAKAKAVAAKPAETTAPAVTKTAEEIAAIRAKNLETIKEVGKRYDQMAQRLAEMED